MSRSNIDKPFFVDVGTSIAAVRCQSNMDVLDRFDHVMLGKAGIEMANNMCDRMNAEVDKFIAAKDAEIVRLRSLVEGLLAASATECANCRYDCGPNRENCIIHETANYIKKVEVEND